MHKLITTVIVTILLSSFPYSSFSQIPQIQLANVYERNVGAQVDDFLVSEKLDGVHAYWNGKKLISRQGNIIKAPRWFTKDFPAMVMDGELWIDRGRFEEVSRIVRCQSCDSEDWREIKFMVFDLPQSPKIFEKRYEELQKLSEISESEYWQAVEQIQLSSESELTKKLDNIVSVGGEGLMLRKKTSTYQAERNNDLLKLKKFEDMEGVVISHIPGNGKYQGKMGAILVEITDENNRKIRFKIGSGFSDKQRENPPEIGSIVTFKFYGKTNKGTPRFASFLRERDDY